MKPASEAAARGRDTASKPHGNSAPSL